MGERSVFLAYPTTATNAARTEQQRVFAARQVSFPLGEKSLMWRWVSPSWYVFYVHPCPSLSARGSRSTQGPISELRQCPGTDTPPRGRQRATSLPTPPCSLPAQAASAQNPRVPPTHSCPAGLHTRPACSGCSRNNATW